MAKFQIQWIMEGDQANVKVSGAIDEDAIFTNPDISKIKKMSVDFQNAESINSCGVREWVKWLETIPLEVAITYEHCQTIMIDQINMVGGLLRKGVKVNSFYVPYFCEKCKIQTKLLYVSGKEFVGTKINAPNDVKCSNCKGSTELDVIESHYFKFLQRQG